MQIPKNPKIYQINTATFLTSLSEQTGEQISLANIPSSEYDRLQSYKVDIVWFMGVWQRSPLARAQDITKPEYVNAFKGSTEDDVIGSAYSIKDYVVDDMFG